MTTSLFENPLKDIRPYAEKCLRLGFEPSEIRDQLIEDYGLKSYADDVYREATRINVLRSLEKVREEISRVNRAAGETVFNPCRTDIVDELIRQYRKVEVAS